MKQSYRIEVDFDQDAGVWYVLDSNLPGLMTEAATLDEMVARLKMIVPDLLDVIAECGGEPDGDTPVPMEVIFHTRSGSSAAAA
jgi:hypothetical protein